MLSIACLVCTLALLVGEVQGAARPTQSCSSYTGTGSVCDAHNCFGYGNGLVYQFGSQIQEVCDDWGAFSILSSDCYLLANADGSANGTKNWNLDVAGVADGCYNNGTVASSHRCFQLSCENYNKTILPTAKVAAVTELWTSAFGTTYDAWENLATQCDTNKESGYNHAVSYYVSNTLPQAEYYLDAISQFSACFSCGNGIRQIVNDTTLDNNFGMRYYRLTTKYNTTAVDVEPWTYQNVFVEGCDDGNLISGDGCSGCNFQPGSSSDDPDSSDPTVFGLPFPWACSCTPDTHGEYFCPVQSCQVEDGWMCREDSSGKSHCKTKVCGNSYVQYENNEECDDGNLIDGDGCSSNCTIELGWDCTEAENTLTRWRQATYFDEPTTTAKSVCAYLPRFKTPAFEIGFLVEWYNTTKNLTTWTNSTGWREALEATGSVQNIQCPYLKTLDDPSKFIHCYDICNKTDSTFTCNNTNTMLFPYNFTRSCYLKNDSIITELIQRLDKAFAIPDLQVDIFNYTDSINYEFAQLWYMPKLTKLSSTWVSFDNATGNFTVVFKLSSSQLEVYAENITKLLASTSFATSWWQSSMTSYTNCTSYTPKILNETIISTCSDPVITYAKYHKQWCDNCCVVNSSVFPSKTSPYYFEKCDTYWYQSLLSVNDLNSCWNDRAFDATQCVTDVCTGQTTEYCTYFNYFKEMCGKPTNYSLTTPIFVVEYTNASDPCGHCRTDEYCPQWYGLECDTCDGCDLLADENGFCDCAAKFVVGKFNTTGRAHVTGLSMRSNNISGEIVHSFSNLTYLTSVFLNDNHISSFADEILWERFEVLRKFHMRSNSLTGILPSGFRYLKALEEMDLANNNLYGIADDAFSGDVCCVNTTGCSNCTAVLEFLDLSNNMINGSVAWSLSRLPALKQLDLSSNQLSSFGRFYFSEAIETLDLSFNQFSDNFDTLELSGLFSTAAQSELSYLDMSNNMLQGTLPNSIQALTNLETWRLNNNWITGSVPFAIGYLTSLRSLELQDNFFSNDLTQNVNNLQQLEYLDISGNYIESIPETMSISTLHTFLMANNWITTVPDLTSLFNLEILDVSRNSIRRLPSTVSSLVELRHLNASGNMLSSLLLLPSFPDMNNLQILDLSENLLVGTLPKNFAMPSIRVLDLHSNSISGSAPTSLLASPTLVTMDLSTNAFTFVPDSWKYLPLLQHLNLANNKIATSLPASMGYLRSLITLDLSNNLFVGNIPTTFGLLASVQSLDLSGNQLHGTIPTNLGVSLVRLQSMNLASNGLTGSMPSELLLIPKLSSLQLQGNSLSGFLPSELCNKGSFISMEGSGTYWCPFPCWDAPLTSNILCSNCPADNTTQCAGADELCETCSYHGQCSFGSITAPSSSGTCVGYTDFFVGDGLENLNCNSNCTDHGTCNNNEWVIQCQCDSTATSCQLDLTNQFFNTTPAHPSLSDTTGNYSRAVANYSIYQNPASLFHYDPTMDVSQPYCRFGVPPSGSCYQLTNGEWVANTGGSCWHVLLLLARCDCDTNYGGDNCEIDLAQQQQQAIVWLSGSLRSGVTLGAVFLSFVFAFLL